LYLAEPLTNLKNQPQVINPENKFHADCKNKDTKNNLIPPKKKPLKMDVRNKG
jgi:hypothetical protein